MNTPPITTPASPSPASPFPDVAFDSIESLTTSFATSAEPTLETTTVTEVALGYHRNQQYSITAMTTTTGAVAERYAYTAYGQPTILNASGSPIGNQQSQIANRFTYTGREWDETLGLYHFRARWMSPLAGRFLGRDPIGYFDGPSHYSFNIWLVWLDPAGLYSISDDPYVIDPDYTNCAGFALDVEDGSHIDPTSSLYNMAAALGFECTQGIGAGECHEHCKDKGLDGCVQGYIYILDVNHNTHNDIKKALQALVDYYKSKDPRVKDLDSLILFHFVDVAKALGKIGYHYKKNSIIDFHFMKCIGNKFEYQPCKAKKGTGNLESNCRDRRGDPVIWLPTSENPENIDTNRILSKFCCCKTGKPIELEKPVTD